MTVADCLAQAAAQGVARLDAQLLLLHALGRAAGERAWLIAHDTDAVAEAAARSFSALCARRADGEPVAYLVGHKEFFGLDLAVDARVLVPRPDTEILVEWALEVLAPGTGPQVLDLGTGSGAIALALKNRRPDARVHGVDRDPDALALAAANATRLKLDVQWRHASWLSGSPSGCDLIVSNPPYVAERDPHLQALAHEPLTALSAGPDGLDDLRTIIEQAPSHLARGGWLLLEHGWDQAHAVRRLLAEAGFEAVQSRRDLAGHERCSGGRWPARA